VRPADFVRALRAEQRAARMDDLSLNVEPGRCLVAAHGVLLATVIQQKEERSAPHRRWLMIDAGMNDLIRPALYQAKHRIVALGRAPGAVQEAEQRVVGPVCESSDDFGDHLLPRALADVPTVAILDAGAYGYTMASRYNGRALPAEAFLRGGRVVAVAPRAPMEAWADERVAVRERT
jgi:diaminopimelate decarboxylase